ncbi:DUF1249 domain-containing protein [Deferribacter thermophilus]|uniref:DUF1249 domain-containing protein n=1 Tax=Deferribacter thermophilus TaxID=53573 RepID=UPI003C180177
MREKGDMIMIYEQIYKKLKDIAGVNNFRDLQIGDFFTVKQEGFMSLNFEVLAKDKDSLIISLNHYYKQNGDMVPDPDVVIKITDKYGIAEVLEYQDTYTYKQVYYTKNSKKYINIKYKEELNKFLNKWLNILQKQGFKFNINKQKSPVSYFSKANKKR